MEDLNKRFLLWLCAQTTCLCTASFGSVSVHVLFEAQKPLLPVLRAQIGIHEVRMRREAILIGNHNESTANLQSKTDGCQKFSVNMQLHSAILNTKSHHKTSSLTYE